MKTSEQRNILIFYFQPTKNFPFFIYGSRNKIKKEEQKQGYY